MWAYPILQRRASFESTGLGAGLSWHGDAWGGYVEGLTYDFDQRFDAVVAASQSPDLARFPRLRALVGSVVTMTQGALEHELSAGIERLFSRSALRLDGVHVKDAIDGLRGSSVSGSWRYAFTRAVDVEVTLGMSDSESLGSLAFGGLTLLLHR